MKRKGPPYKVVLGNKSQPHPPCVTYIHQNKLILKGSKEELKKLNLDEEISFAGDGPYEENSELIQLLIKLNSMGFAFSYDYKVDLSPSAMMQLLQDKGELESEYREISWRGPGLWTITTYELEGNT